MKTAKTGVLMLNMGGPDRQRDVRPYLRNIFRDPRILNISFGALLRPPLAWIISALRARRSRARYQQIGGETPLNKIAWHQAERLQKILREKGMEAEVRPAMRYWHPFCEEALAEWSQAGLQQVVALSMYPHYCEATTGSSLAEFRQLATRHLNHVPTAEISHWHKMPAYVDFLVARITAALKETATHVFTAVLFSAHSIPQALADSGDPYRDQVEETVRLIVARLPETVTSRLGFQSATGPVRWLQPSTRDVIAGLARRGIRFLILVPLGFAADNLETLWDIEKDLMPFAALHDIQRVVRIDCPNYDESFLQGLAGLVLQACEER